MEAQQTPTAEIENVFESGDDVHVRVSVLENDEWIGDFVVVFERRRVGGKIRHVADWSTIKSGGNGMYVEETPTFWPVEHAAEELNNRHITKEFVALDTGPNDI